MICEKWTGISDLRRLAILRDLILRSVAPMSGLPDIGLLSAQVG